jgi:hypothetical protein
MDMGAHLPGAGERRSLTSEQAANSTDAMANGAEVQFGADVRCRTNSLPDRVRIESTLCLEHFFASPRRTTLSDLFNDHYFVSTTASFMRRHHRRC